MPDFDELVHDSVINACIYESHITAERSHEMVNLLAFTKLTLHSVEEGFNSFAEVVTRSSLVHIERGVNHVVCVSPKACWPAVRAKSGSLIDNKRQNIFLLAEVFFVRSPNREVTSLVSDMIFLLDVHSREHHGVKTNISHQSCVACTCTECI